MIAFYSNNMVRWNYVCDVIVSYLFIIIIIIIIINSYNKLVCYT